MRAIHLSAAEARRAGLSAAASKYHVAPAAERTVDGIRFDSKAEMQRWFELQLLQHAGEISDLARQPSFQLVDPFTDAQGRRHRGVRYVADFMYSEGGRVVVEDVKGVRTQAYAIKRQLFALKWPGVIFREVRGGRA